MVYNTKYGSFSFNQPSYKIAFSGAQCTGKTTMINELKKEKLFTDNFLFTKSASTIVREEGFDINEKSNIDTQTRIKDIQLNQLCERYGNSILDRCLVDSMAYTLYLKNNNKKENFENLYDEYKEILKTKGKIYDIVFFCPIHFDLIQSEDNKRSMDEKFRETINEYIYEILNFYHINYIMLRGSVEKRYQIVLEVLKEFNIIK